MRDSLPPENVYRILEFWPIVLVSTLGDDGPAILMAMGFHVLMRTGRH